MIIDCHSHRPAPYPEGIICVGPADFSPAEGQLYSVGIHPWDAASATPEALEALRQAAAHPQVLAIGETGIDTLKGAQMFRQLPAFRAQAEIAESTGKPLVIHDVRGHDMILAMYKDIKPRQPWIIHGFRGKPTVAAMLALPGIYFSFGEKFNAESLRGIPAERLLAETDDSALTIEDILASQANAAGMAPDAYTALIAANTAAVFKAGS